MTHEASTPPQPDDALLSIKEAAEILLSYVDTLRYWRHLGIGPRSFKIGRRIYWRSEVYRWPCEQEAGDAGIHKH
jgi:hypothetical protein